jgi:phage-related protein (TIGR01555 family)
MTRVHDGLVNMVSGLGTARDKGATAAYSVALMSEADLVAAYTESAIAARVVTMPAEDAVREWREWSAENVEVSVIEAEEHRVNLQLKLLEANTLARLLGTAVIVIGADGADMSKPLVPDRIKKGGLQYLEVLTTRHIQPGPLSEKLGVGTFGKPEYWTLNADGQSLPVHPSRLVVLYGSDPLPHVGVNMRTGEGMSVLQGAMPAIKRVDEVAANINSLVYEAKVDVFGIPDLMQSLASRGDEYANEVIRRVTLAATAKGINGMLIRDGAETYEQKSASFGTLDTILDKFMALGSAVAGIPMTLLFGVSPGGLNATGASDIRAYYDRVRVQQTMKLGPAMAVLDEVLIRSALGNRPDDVHYNWRPLWQATALEKAQVGKLIVDTMAVLDAMEIMPAESIQAATVSALVECGAYPGLEAAAMDDGGEDAEDEDGAT